MDWDWKAIERAEQEYYRKKDIAEAEAAAVAADASEGSLDELDSLVDAGVTLRDIVARGRIQAPITPELHEPVRISPVRPRVVAGRRKLQVVQPPKQTFSAAPQVSLSPTNDQGGGRPTLALLLSFGIAQALTIRNELNLIEFLPDIPQLDTLWLQGQKNGQQQDVASQLLVLLRLRAPFFSDTTEQGQGLKFVQKMLLAVLMGPEPILKSFAKAAADAWIVLKPDARPNDRAIELVQLLDRCKHASHHFESVLKIVIVMLAKDVADKGRGQRSVKLASATIETIREIESSILPSGREAGAGLATICGLLGRLSHLDDIPELLSFLCGWVGRQAMPISVRLVALRALGDINIAFPQFWNRRIRFSSGGGSFHEESTSESSCLEVVWSMTTDVSSQMKSTAVVVLCSSLIHFPIGQEVDDDALEEAIEELVTLVSLASVLTDSLPPLSCRLASDTLEVFARGSHSGTKVISTPHQPQIANAAVGITLELLDIETEEEEEIHLSALGKLTELLEATTLDAASSNLADNAPLFCEGLQIHPREARELLAGNRDVLAEFQEQVRWSNKVRIG